MTGKFTYTWDGQTKDGIPFRLRPATPSDARVITANIQAVCAEQVYLYTDSFVLTDEWRHALANSVDEDGGRLLVVAQVNGQVVGHLRLFSEWYGVKGRHVGEVGLVITKPWRERGIGSTMLVYTFEWARYARFRKLIASVSATNKRALHLFARFGFVQEGCRSEQIVVLEQYVDEVLLGRFLSNSQLI